MSWEALKTAISNTITDNGNNEITGEVLRNLLNNNVIPQLGASNFKGLATPSTAPGNPEKEVFYLAADDGVYANFGGLVLDKEFVSIRYINGVWVKERIDLTDGEISFDNVYKPVSGRTVKQFDMENKEDFIASKLRVKNDNTTDGETSFKINGSSVSLGNLDAEYVAADSAFRFTGTQKIIVNQPINMLGGFTLLAEVNIENITSEGRFFSNGIGFNPAIGGFAVQLSSFGGGIPVLVIKGGSSVNVISDSLDPSIVNSWIKVAFVVAPDGSVKMYLDGTLLTLQSGSAVITPVNSTNPVILGNMDNSGAYNRPLLGSLKRLSLFKSELDIADVGRWNNKTLKTLDAAAFNVDFSEVTTSQKDGLYWYEGGLAKYRKVVSGGNLITQIYNPATLGWDLHVETGGGDQTGRSVPLVGSFGADTDGWGNGVISCDTQPLTSDRFEYINTGVDLSTSVGEAFHGLAAAGEWIVQAPQDHHSAVFYNTITKEVREVDLSAYVRAIPSSGNNFRDKFNGATTTHGGRYVWLAPSWTTHCVKIDTTDWTIVQDWEVNTTHNDAYNGIISTRKYVWLVTHSKEDLPRINIETGVLTFITLTEPNPGDYNFDEASVANNRSFLGGSDNGDGTIWLHPRRSKHLVKIDEETGSILLSTAHPITNDPGWGFFHGATNVNGRIWFSPWGEEKVTWYDIASDTWGTIDVDLTTPNSNSQYSFGSTTDGRFVYMPPFRAREIVKIDTLDNSVHVIDATELVTSFISNKVRSSTPSDGFAGGCLFLNGYIWYSSSFESCFLKVPVFEMGNGDVRSVRDLKARKRLFSGEGEVYFSEDLRLKRVGDNVLKQKLTNGTWSTLTTI